MILTIENVSKSFSEKKLLDNVNLAIDNGDKLGLIGVNGTGKTTLLKIIVGLEECDRVNNIDGKVWVNPYSSIAYLSQHPHMDQEVSIMDYVLKNVNHAEEYEVKTILNKLGFSNYNKLIKNLSGGERRRIALAATLLQDSDLLILDEPTNHLDNDMVYWLESFLKKTKKAVLMITHDRYFLNNVVNKIIELDNGNLYTYEGNYSKFLELKELREEMEAATLRKKKSLFRKELAWMQQGPKARSTKSTERIARFEKLAKDIKVEQKNKLVLNSKTSRIGSKTFELENVTKKYDDRTVINNFSYVGLKYDRIGIVGKNGAGKTTLLNLITQKLLPTSGNVELGETVKLAYFDQHLKEMPEEKRIIDYIKSIAEYIEFEDKTLTASQMLELFLFKPTIQYSPISKLSGGEKRRLQLLALLITNPNFLVLDEPTNDLDIETLTILEEYLDNFKGVILTVSHDRYFLDKVVDKIFEVTSTGTVEIHNGGYSDYFENINRVVATPLTTEKPKNKSNSKLEQKKLRSQIKKIEKDIEISETKLEELNKLVLTEEVYSDPIKLKEIGDEIKHIEVSIEALYEEYMMLGEST